MWENTHSQGEGQAQQTWWSLQSCTSQHASMSSLTYLLGKGGMLLWTWFYIYQSWLKVQLQLRLSVFLCNLWSFSEIWFQMWLTDTIFPKFPPNNLPTGWWSIWMTGKMTEWAISPFLKHGQLCEHEQVWVACLSACMRACMCFISVCVLLRSTSSGCQHHHLQ